MTGRKARTCRSRWFLLKDSVIFVLVMFLLQIIQVQLATSETMMSNTSRKNEDEIIKTSNGTKIDFQNTSAEVMNLTNILENPPHDINVPFSNKSDTQSASNSISNKNSSNTSRNSSDRKVTPATNLAIHRNIAPEVNVIRENVMLPSSDPEKEARILYEKSLKEYHGANEAVRHEENYEGAIDDDNESGRDIENANTERTLHRVCEMWARLRCHCTGHLNRLSLSCRRVGLSTVPAELPNDVVAL